MLHSEDFLPLTFLRCHSKNNDSADVQTSVWHCSFHPEKPLLATCGGNSVCVIEAVWGKVKSKFYVQTNEELLALSWGSCSSESVVVTGGKRSVLYILDPANREILLEQSLQKKKDPIHCLTFHPKAKDFFFCGSSKGEIFTCKLINQPELFVEILSFVSLGYELSCLALDSVSKRLFSGTSNGLAVTLFEDLTSKSKPKTVSLQLPKARRKTYRGATLVDSVEVLHDDLIAVKYALHGQIYICDVGKGMRKAHEERFDLAIELDIVNCLTWSQTDNYYMNMGVSQDYHWLGCGDDNGDIWLYDLTSLRSSSVEPTMILPWPVLEDPESDKKRKLPLDVYDIVVNKVAFNSNGSLFAAVTNKNLVCLWKSVELNGDMM